MIKKTSIVLIAFMACCIYSSAFAQNARLNAGQDIRNIIPMRERVQIEQGFWDWKRKNLLPEIMREQGVDLWIIRNDEEPLYRMTSYKEHPVFTSLLPANHEGMVLPSKYAKSSMDVPEYLFFYDTGDEIEYIAPQNYDEITGLVRERDPKNIAISRNGSEDMKKALGSKYASRTVDSWTLGVRWLETNSPGQISIYRFVQGLANDIIAMGYSNAVIVPDITTTDDLNWWFRHKYLELDIEIENHPSVSVQRRPEYVKKYNDSPDKFRRNRTSNGVNVVIRRGDIVSLDSDIMVMGLITDSHQHAYVLLKGEDDVPEELKEALRLNNHMQDEFRKVFVVGRTGKEIVEASRAIPRDPRIISSNLGFHPPPKFIRRFSENGLMFSRGSYVAGLSSGSGYKRHPIVSNEHKLYYNTMYAYEPHTRVRVPGWGEAGVELGIGQMTVFTEEGMEYLDRPQYSPTSTITTEDGVEYVARQDNSWHIIK
jgi:hypothetical protein